MILPSPSGARRRAPRIRPVCAAVLAFAAAGATPATAADRAFELVSFPRAGVSFGLGKPAGDRSLLRSASPIGGSGRLQFASSSPVPGQPAGTTLNPFVATRTGAGWERRYVGMPEGRNGLDTIQGVIAFAPDFTHSLWFAGGQSGPDPSDPSAIAASTIGLVPSLLIRGSAGAVKEQLQGDDAETDPNATPSVTTGAISDDGTTATFPLVGARLTADGSIEGAVYRREVGAPVELVSRDAQGDALTVTSSLEAASDDGGRVLFSHVDTGTGAQRLGLWTGTDATTTVAEGASLEPVAVDDGLDQLLFLTRDALAPGDGDTSADLYRWNAGGATPTLLSKGASSGGNTSDPADCATPLPITQLDYAAFDCDVAFLGASDDLRTVVFLSPEVLDGATGATDGAVNLYVIRDGGAPRYVGPYSSQPFQIVAPNVTVREDAIVFDSDVTRAVGVDTGGQVQVQRWDRATGTVRCLSCRADGSATASPATSRQRLPGNGAEAEGNVTADGRHVYLTTAEPLSDDDINTRNDVYEYDVDADALVLISAGSEQVDSNLAGVSPDGTDVFFETRQTLVPEDRNGSVWKVYDARVGGGFAVAPAPPSCDGDACRPPAAPAPDRGPIATGDVNPEAPQGEPEADPEPAVKAPSKATLRSFARSGRIRLTIQGLQTGDRVRVRVVIGGRVAAKAETTARKGTTATATLRLSTKQRRSLTRSLARRATEVAFRVETLTTGDGDETTISLPKTKKGASK